MTNKIDFTDRCGIQCEADFDDDDGIAIHHDPEGEAEGYREIALNPACATRLGAFLLSAASVKLVEAARATVAARQRLAAACDAAEMQHASDVWIKACDALAAELAKLDAMTGDK